MRSLTWRLPVVQRQAVVVGAGGLLQGVDGVRSHVLLNMTVAVRHGALLGSGWQERSSRRATLSVAMVVRRLRRAASVMQWRSTAAHLRLLLVAGTLLDGRTAALLRSALEGAVRLELGWERASLGNRRRTSARSRSSNIALVSRRGGTEIDLQVLHFVGAAVLKVIRHITASNHHHALSALALRVLAVIIAGVRYLSQVTAVARVSA